MKVSIEYAAEHLDELVLAVQSGEAVEIECADEPGVRLAPFHAVESAMPGAEWILGVGKAFARLPNPEELEQIDREWKSEIEEKAIGVHAE